ncbi:MAG: hypothetical protein ABIJ00_03145 [Candidatus Eisenbacteria bacterium]
MNRKDNKRIVKDLPAEIRSQCVQMAKEISEQSDTIRDRKVFAARIRICSGYYDSERVVGGIASRLISEVAYKNISS